MMEVAGDLPSLVHLTNIMQEQLESLSIIEQRTKYGSGTVENLKLGIYLVRGLLLKEDLILHVDKSWQQQLDVMTSLCYDAEDILSEMDYKMMMLNNRKVLLNLYAVCLQIPELSSCRGILMSSLKPNKLINCQRHLKKVIREFRFHLDLFLCQIPFPIKPCKRSSQSPYSDQKVPLIGRDADRNTIFDFLFNENSDSLGLSVIGMHGVGKTALALDILNDHRVERYFDNISWVPLKGPFYPQEICEQVVYYRSYDSFINKNQDRKSTLLDHLHYGKNGRNLLVLDNLVDVTFTEWFDFRSSYFTLSGGKVLITSSNNDIALVTQTTRHYLHPLSDENCEKVIYSRLDMPKTDIPSFCADIETLAKKSNGLPIVANFLGLQFKDENQRESLLNKDLWEVPEFKEIRPILTLSYSKLEPNLKKCFAYLSLFPRGYHFDMMDLIQLWIAEGFIEWPDNSSLSKVCNDNLRIFERWLIFQPQDISVHDGRKHHVIHEFAYDLAKLISSNTCFCWDDELQTRVLDNNIRHLSLSIQILLSNFWKEIQRLKLSNSCLRTFLPFNGMNYISHIPTSFFKSVPYLRVLSLRKTGVHKIPYSIRILKFLRYLDVSETSLKKLPEELGELSYLQILKLKSCLHLKHLPRKFKNLVTLRYIDWEIQDINRLMSMPSSIGSLTALQRLPLFRVGVENGFRIQELKNMVHLQGSIRIKNLENVQDKKEAEAADLSTKVYLETLQLEWSSLYSNAQKAADVLTALQPHENLKELRITNYVGHNVPQWLRQLKKLRNLEFVDCHNLCSLPSFELLTSLVNLKITRCSKLKLLPKLPPSVDPSIIKKCDLLDPSLDDQLLPTSDDDSRINKEKFHPVYQLHEVVEPYSEGRLGKRDSILYGALANLRSYNARFGVNVESSSAIRFDECEITEEELIESKSSAIGEIIDPSKETKEKIPDTSKEAESEVADTSIETTRKVADTSDETASKLALQELFKAKLEPKSLAKVIEESSSPIGRTDDAGEITTEKLVKSKLSIVGKIDDTNKEIERKKVVQNKFKAELKQIDLADNEMKYYLEAEEEMRLLCIMCSHEYDFEEETLIQLWVARGFLKGEHKNRIGHIYFKILLSAKYILPSGRDFTSKRDKYRANVDICKDELASLTLEEPSSESCDSATTMTKGDLAIRMLEEQSSTSKIVLYHKANEGDLHLSWEGDDFDEKPPTPLGKNFNNLKALFLCKNSSRISSVPSYVFFAIRLEVLHLGGTRITNLPSSIGNLVELRYLDLSYTLIEALPDNVQHLSKLETLKLNNCERLFRLPGEIRKLTSLEYLELDVIRQLTIMPRGMGSLTKLKSLSAFIVHKGEGRSLKELKNMNNLKGSFCISKLENVMDSHEAEEASLESKKFIMELDLRWSDKHEKLGSNSVDHDDKILDLLRPNSNLKQLWISCYGGKRFPDWVGSPSFHMLNSITLFKCDDANELPSLGQLPSLKSLTLIELDNVEEIGNIYSNAFPSLETLKIIGLSQLKIWKDAKEGNYKSLSKIIVERCPRLEAIPSILFHLHNLRHMEVLHCSALTLSTLKELPTSLSTLIIEDCPLLVKEFKKRKGKHRLNFKHVQDAWINQEAITDSYQGKSHYIKSCFAR